MFEGSGGELKTGLNGYQQMRFRLLFEAMGDGREDISIFWL